jgi:hypothetical protein
MQCSNNFTFAVHVALNQDNHDRLAKDIRQHAPVPKTPTASKILSNSHFGFLAQSFK